MKGELYGFSDPFFGTRGGCAEQICKFLLRVGVRGTPRNSYKISVFESVDATAPATPAGLRGSLR